MGKRFREEEIDAAKDTDLVCLAEELGYTPVRVGRYYGLKEMSSMRIYNRRTFFRWSTRYAVHPESGSAIDFLMLYAGLSFVEAMEKLLERKKCSNALRSQKRDIPVPAEPERREFILPPENKDSRRLYAYLIKQRNIPADVVTWFRKQGLIYEEAWHHNIVFVSRDKEGIARHAFLRGTYGDFKCDVEGNDKRYGFAVATGSRVLYVYEGAIDLMSDLALTADYEPNRLALGMLHDEPLLTFLQEHPQIEEIYFGLDLDKRGREAEAMFLEKYAAKGYLVTSRPPSLQPGEGKDFNDLLLRRVKEAEKENV